MLLVARFLLPAALPGCGPAFLTARRPHVAPTSRSAVLAASSPPGQWLVRLYRLSTPSRSKRFPAWAGKPTVRPANHPRGLRPVRGDPGREAGATNSSSSLVRNEGNRFYSGLRCWRLDEERGRTSDPTSCFVLRFGTGMFPDRSIRIISIMLHAMPSKTSIRSYIHCLCFRIDPTVPASSCAGFRFRRRLGSRPRLLRRGRNSHTHHQKPQPLAQRVEYAHRSVPFFAFAAWRYRPVAPSLQGLTSSVLPAGLRSGWAAPAGLHAGSPRRMAAKACRHWPAAGSPATSGPRSKSP